MREVKLLSIVIPYFNKRHLLLNTLKSINHFRGEYPIEVIIVDDTSSPDQRITDVKAMFPKLNINLIVVQRSPITWRGPTVAYNIGFNAAKGDVILINGTDCLHMGDIISYVFSKLPLNSYISFSAYKGMFLPDGIFHTLNWDDPAKMEITAKYFKTEVKENWHVHSRFFYYLIPFCAAIATEDMEKLSGMDERFERGIEYDDNDFVDRVINMGLDVFLIDEPFCVHQKHPLTNYSNNINKTLYTQLCRNEPNRVKAITNKVYVR